MLVLIFWLWPHVYLPIFPCTTAFPLWSNQEEEKEEGCHPRSFWWSGQAGWEDRKLDRYVIPATKSVGDSLEYFHYRTSCYSSVTEPAELNFTGMKKKKKKQVRFWTLEARLCNLWAAANEWRSIYPFCKFSGGSWFIFCWPWRWGGSPRCVPFVINLNLALVDSFCNIWVPIL